MLNDKVVEYCCTFPFTLLCDGGNDQTDRKYFGIMVRYWDKEADQPAERFLCMPVCNIGTAEQGQIQGGGSRGSGPPLFVDM